ncbi:MAG TPA: hemerythrin domain-containing protein [Gammaproteobacteria bacterium]
MNSIRDFLGDDHYRCDDLFAQAERQVAEGDWDKARASHDAFIRAMERHFAMEESALFPSFEQASGSEMGPTAVMRHEHGQMRQLFAAMEEAVQRNSVDDYLGNSETLLILMRQHNAKEEQILYPMIDRMLGAELPSLLQQMVDVGAN